MVRILVKMSRCAKPFFFVLDKSFFPIVANPVTKTSSIRSGSLRKSSVKMRGRVQINPRKRLCLEIVIKRSKFFSLEVTINLHDRKQTVSLPPVDCEKCKLVQFYHRK